MAAWQKVLSIPKVTDEPKNAKNLFKNPSPAKGPLSMPAGDRPSAVVRSIEVSARADDEGETILAGPF